MSALTQARMPRLQTRKNVALVLAAGQKVFRGGRACIDTGNKVIVKAASGNANLIGIGEFMEDFDNSGSTTTGQIMVSLDHEIVTRFYDNATGGSAVTAANSLYTDSVYWLDDHTVTTSSSGNSKAGRVWSVDSTNGVEIEATVAGGGSL